MVLLEEEQLNILNSIAKDVLKEITTIFKFGLLGNTESYDENGNEVVIHGYSILNTDLFGIEYWHSEQETAYEIKELYYEIKVGKNESTRFLTITDAEKYLKTTKRKFIKSPFSHEIKRFYSSHVSDFYNFNDLQDFPQLKHLEQSIKLKKTVFSKNVIVLNK